MGSLRRRVWRISSTSTARGFTPLGEVEADPSGVLMAARSEASGALVDIRVLAPALTADRAFMHRLGRDMSILKEVRHTNLVSVMDFDKRAGAVVYESVPGSTLTQLLAGQGPLELAASLVLLEDCIAGLEALHKVGVLHRNVTPDAVVIETTGAVLLRDAGLSVPDVIAGRLPGQQPYPAPEILGGAAPTSGSDLYAATAVFVEAIGGRASEIGVRSDLRPLLAEGMATDPSQRSATLDGFRGELDDYARATIGESWRKEGRALLTAAAAAQATRAIRVTPPAGPAPAEPNDAAVTLALLRSPAPRDQRILAGLGAVGFAALIGIIVVAHGLPGTANAPPGLVLPPNLVPNIFAPATPPGTNPTAPTSAPNLFGTKPTTDPTTKPSTNPTANPTANPTSDPTGNPTPNPTPNPTSPPLVSQTVTFTTSVPSGATYSGSYTVSASGGGSGNPVVFSSLSPTVCVRAAGTTFAFTGVGTCTIAANQAGSSQYSAAPQRVMPFAVGQASQTISLGSTPPSPTYGGSFILSSSGGGSGNPVVLAADPAFPGCVRDSVNANQFDFTSAGTCVIDANQAGNPDYIAAQQRQLSFDVAPAAQTINFTSTPPTCPCVGLTYTVSAAGGASGNPVTFTVVSGGCTIPPGTDTMTVTAVGTCTIQADQVGNTDYSAAPPVQETITISS